MDNVDKTKNTDAKRKRGARLATRYVVRVAIMSAMLTALKFAFSFVPNVEVVTLLILVYAAAFGLAYALPATSIFCAVEVALYGAGSWVLLYFVYWNLLAVTASVLLKRRNLILAVVIAAVGSELFGVLSACCDTLFCVANLTGGELGLYWVAYYLRGVYFDVVHIVSNIIVVGLLFRPLVSVCARTAPDAYSARSAGSYKLINKGYEYQREER